MLDLVFILNERMSTSLIFSFHTDQEYLPLPRDLVIRSYRVDYTFLQMRLYNAILYIIFFSN